MDPFANDLYDSDSDDEGNFRWPGVAGAGVSEELLMRGDLEISPLVTAVPPMPEAGAIATAKDHVTGIPSFSRGLPKVALKKRKVLVGPQGMAHSFGAQVVSIPPSASSSQDQTQQPGFPAYSHPSTYSAPTKEELEMKPAAVPMQPKQSPLVDMSRVFPPPALDKDNTSTSDQIRSSAGMHPPLPFTKQVDDGQQAVSSLSTSPPGNVFIGSKPVSLAPTSGLSTLSSAAASTSNATQLPPLESTGDKPVSASERAVTGSVTPPVPVKADDTTVTKGGIFDDAEDDMDVDLPAASLKTGPKHELPTDVRGTSTPPRPVSESMKELSPQQRPNIRSIVLGNSPKPNPGPSVLEEEKKPFATRQRTTFKAVKEETASDTEGTAPKADGDETKPRKRKVSRSASRKVLVAKKEREMALSFLRDKDDLLDCLPKEDCFFLAQEFWVFTVQQLSFILGLGSSEEERSDEALEKACRIREDILVRLCTSKLLGGGIDTSEGTKAAGDSSAENPVHSAHAEPPSSDADANPDSAPKPNDSLGESKPAPEDNDAKVAEGEKNSTPETDVLSTGFAEADQGLSDAKNALDAKAEKSPDPSKRPAAEARLGSWKTSIENFVEGKKTPVEERFPLDGPISCLMPMATRNFLASVPVLTLFGFLGLKRTETGAICDLLKFWRRECSLAELSLLALAKHLLGVSGRFESAISAIPPVDANTRRWMGDPIIVMTGAAREFLVDDYGICTAAEFVEGRTKDLATKLAAWRVRKGLVPLKGSGKVAMVSGWKALAREAMEAEASAGEILKDIELTAFETPAVNEDEIDDACSGSSEQVKPRKAATKSKAAKKAVATKSDSAPTPLAPRPMASRKLSLESMDRQAQYALHTKLFLEDVLGQDTTKILSSAGVTTAAELLEMKSDTASTLSRCILDSEMAEDNDGCDTLIDTWCKKLWNELDLLSPKRKSSTEDVAAASPPAKKAKTKIKNKPAAVQPRKPDLVSRAFKDPYEILSSVTRRFLESMSITSAESFLTTRTTDIATEFVQWRIQEGMPELKGLGAIASVSGWKASIRKAASEMGMADVAVMEPSNKTSWGPYSRSTYMRPKENVEDASLVVRAEKPEPLVQEDVLMGKSRCLFAVVGTEDRPDLQFRFELSLRRPDENHLLALYITYKGAAAGSTELRGKRPSLPQAALECADTEGNFSRHSLMKDVAYLSKSKSSGDYRSPFAFGAGMGLIDLSEYGARPVKNQELSLLKEQVKAFVLLGEEKSSISSTPPALVSTKSNVILRRRSQDKYQFFLDLVGPVEKGQTTEVCFPSVSQLLHSGFFRGTDFERRHLIGEAFQLLARSDLEGMLSFLEDELLSTIGYDGILSAAVGYTGGSNEDFKKACAARRRLHWVTIRLGNALGESVEIGDNLYFGPLTWQKDNAYKSYPAAIILELRDAIALEVRNEMHCALELDCVCGSKLRESWCPLAQQSLGKFVECILNYYNAPDGASAEGMLETLKSCLTETLSALVAAESIADYVMACSFTECTDKIGSKSIRVAIESIQRGRLSGNNDLDSDDKLPLIACRELSGEEQPENSRNGSVLMRRQSDVKDLSQEINEPWYRQLQWDIVMTVVASSGSLLARTERPQFMNQRMLYELKQLAIKEAGLEDLEDPRMDCLEPLHKAYAASESVRAPEPHSSPFFLCLVWPTLRKLGWRLEAGESLDSVSFIAPEGKLSALRANPWKQQHDQSRARLAREANRTGLGNVSKLTKRLIVALLPHPATDEDIEVSEAPTSNGVSAKVALRLFFNKIIGDLENDDKNGRALAKKIVDALAECFEDIAPRLAGFSSNDIGTRSDTDTVGVPDTGLVADATTTEISPDDVHDGCDYLLRLLLVLPSILRQSDLPLQEINDTSEVCQELVEFITSEHEGLFNKGIHPPRQHTARQHKSTRPALAARLQALRSSSTDEVGPSDGKTGNSGAIAMSEMVVDEDRKNLTDFVVTVLGQAIPCRASEKDVSKKFRRIHVGYPGFVCRHCLSQGGEGKYFFTTIESLTTASTVFEKHVLKCPSVPPIIKSEVVAARARHADQRKELPSGSQQAYFNRLWDRLRSCKIEGVASGVYALESYAKRGSEVNTTESNAETAVEVVSFKDHIELLDFVRTTAPWKTNIPVLEALNQYYNCLDYGGRIFYTSSAPEHFSAEWLLAKVAPRPRVSPKKTQMMPG